MPKEHGVVFDNDQLPRCNFGIWRVFDPWVAPELQVRQGHVNTPLSRPLLIEFHFRRVLRRLLRSLERLHHRFREWDLFLAAGAAAGPEPQLVFEIPEEAGIAADSVFHYLNLCIDDVARVAHFILTDGGVLEKEPDGFSELKQMLMNGLLDAPETVKKLFSDLEPDDSWWALGFKRGRGMRQRLTHYTDLLVFQGRSKPGDTVMTADVALTAIGAGRIVDDFEPALRRLMAGLFEWLDVLASELFAILTDRLATRGVSWHPLAEHCPSIMLNHADGGGSSGHDYIYLPRCDARN